jgi:hypothetical protein
MTTAKHTIEVHQFRHGSQGVVDFHGTVERVVRTAVMRVPDCASLCLSPMMTWRTHSLVKVSGSEYSVAACHQDGELVYQLTLRSGVALPRDLKPNRESRKALLEMIAQAADEEASDW